jgi:hypothetical protein
MSRSWRSLDGADMGISSGNQIFNSLFGAPFGAYSKKYVSQAKYSWVFAAHEWWRCEDAHSLSSRAVGRRVAAMPGRAFSVTGHSGHPRA